MDGNIDAAMNCFWFLSVVNSVGSEVFVQEREVLFTSEALILGNLTVSLDEALIEHY